jgi:hypothetical protein
MAEITLSVWLLHLEINHDESLCSTKVSKVYIRRPAFFFFLPWESVDKGLLARHNQRPKGTGQHKKNPKAQRSSPGSSPVPDSESVMGEGWHSGMHLWKNNPIPNGDQDSRFS